MAKKQTKKASGKPAPKKTVKTPKKVEFNGAALIPAPQENKKSENKPKKKDGSLTFAQMIQRSNAGRKALADML